MQGDVDAEWGEGDEMHHYIQEELPRVAVLPPLTRYRSFSHALETDPIRVGRVAQDFFVRKRRRYDDGSCDASRQPYTRALPQTLSDSFDVAARQADTFAWLTAQPRSVADLTARFALDRKLGAAPSQACTNRALQNLGAAGELDAVLDVVEDAGLDSGRLALSTVLAAVAALHSHPLRAARVALSLHGSLPAGVAIPPAVWVGLGSSLARYSHRLPKPLDEHFMRLLDAVIGMVRGRGDATLGESLLVDYGGCLLVSRRPLSASVALVRVELLLSGSGERRSAQPAGDSADSMVALGGFFSDLLVAVCSGPDAAVDEESASADGGFASARDLLCFCGSVVGFAGARLIRLAPAAFDSVLLVCDAARDYGRMCILFAAMCVLSVPTLRSTLRLLEVLNTVPAAAARMTEVLGRSPPGLMAWCIERFGSLGALHARPGSKLDSAALLSLCEQLGTLLACSGDPSAPVVPRFPTTTTAAQLRGAVGTASGECASARCAWALVSSFAAQHRQHAEEPVESAAGPSPEALLALEAANAIVSEAFLQEAGEAAQSGPAEGLFESAVATHTCGRIDAALAVTLSSPQIYCNVLDVAAMNVLAEQPAAEAAFERMMGSYAAKGGAVAVLPAELLSSSFGMSDAARAMARAWRHSHPEWFALLPYSLSLQLDGSTDLSLAMDFFQRVRAAGHQKVALLTGSAQGAAVAKERGVQPAILLPDLLTRLGVALPAATKAA